MNSSTDDEDGFEDYIVCILLIIFCSTKLNLRNTFFGINYLLLLNENLLNFTICRNKKLEGDIPGPDRASNFQAQIWARLGRAFHYWSGARQITLSGPDRRTTKISARAFAGTFDLLLQF